MAAVRIPTDKIHDWGSFHSECASAFGFPAFYGRNMNAWIECLSYLPDGDGMSCFKLSKDEKLFIHVPDFDGFSKRIPDVCVAMLECTSFVNRRHIDSGDHARLVLVLE